MIKPATLDALCGALNDLEEGRPEGVCDSELYRGAGLDMAGLPTFGGEAPAHTREVYSWDATGLLVVNAGPDFCRRTGERRSERRPWTILERAEAAPPQHETRRIRP